MQRPESLAARRGRVWFFTGLALLLLISRVCHLRILWAEEGYGAAAGVQTILGKVIYRDFWFDKPPLAAWIYVLWGAFPGWPLRLAGAAFAFLTAVAAWKCASALWSPREGTWAAGLTAFFQIFDIPPAVMTIGPDLLTVPLALLGVGCAHAGAPVWAGLACALAVHSNAKGLLLVPVILLWAEKRWLVTLACAMGFFLVGLGALAAMGALPGYWHQVWEFGRVYSQDTFVTNPWREGALRTANWLGFHAALLIPAFLAFGKQPAWERIKFAVWLAAGAVGVVAGLRFFPRYYLMLLPPLVLLASRGLALLWPPSSAAALAIPWGKMLRFLAVALLLIPLGRFGPRYALLASDLLTGHPHHWADLALNQDSQAVARLLKHPEKYGTDPSGKGTDPISGGNLTPTTLFVWGYRPDLFAYTRFSSGTRFLDSQLLTGVLGDRHLTSTHVSIPEAAQNRADLVKTWPTFLVDGLGPMNPHLAIDQYPELRAWLASNYEKVGQTPYSVIYKRK